MLRLVGQGLTIDEVSRTLFLGPLTAPTHRSRIVSEPAARDRVQLVVVASATGLVLLLALALAGQQEWGSRRGVAGVGQQEWGSSSGAAGAGQQQRDTSRGCSPERDRGSSARQIRGGGDS